MANLKTVIDIDGTDIFSTVLLQLLNSFPGVTAGEIKFSTLGTSSGIGFFPTSGAVLLSDTADITGHVKQVCLYPFNIVYRAAPQTEAQKLRVKEFLDTLGKWLELQTVTIGGEYCRLSEYPTIDDTRKIKSIRRTSAGHLYASYTDGIEDWLISATLQYENEYYK